MNIKLGQIDTVSNAKIKLSGSKSETNRLLLLQALYPSITIDNGSDSDDSEVMRKAFASIRSSQDQPITIDIRHAGTAMRFLTAFFALQDGKETVLTGSSRMQERPIQILVEALQQLGADISYERLHGFPPLRIKGKKLTGNQVTLAADVSSQYISALLLIAPKLENGLQLTLQGEVTSAPYIQMTLDLLNQIGFKTKVHENHIIVFPAVDFPKFTTITVESDWSSASYYFSIVALSKFGTQITLSNFKTNSLQGDSALVEIYKDFGVETTFINNSIVLVKTNRQLSTVNYQLNRTPDLAQTIAVTSFGLGMACSLNGLNTLKIKETNRLEALQNELMKLGATVTITDDSLTMIPAEKIQSAVTIQTYNDHRMALAFAPLALKIPLEIADAEVVSKSYPNYWNDLKRIGFRIN